MSYTSWATILSDSSLLLLDLPPINSDTVEEMCTNYLPLQIPDPVMYTVFYFLLNQLCTVINFSIFASADV